MSSFRWKYNEIFIIFRFVSITLGVHRIAWVESNQSFCEKLANAKPSPSFSLADQLRMQMFTFAQDNEIIMVADGVRYVLDTQDLEATDYKMIVINNKSIDKPWLSKRFTRTPDSITKVISVVKLPSDEPLEMAYELGTSTGRIVMLVTNKMIYEYREETKHTDNVVQKIDRSKLKFSIVHDQLSSTDSKAYVLSQGYGENVGLLIYQLNLPMWSKYDEKSIKCLFTANSDCLKKMAYYYIRREQFESMARIVHPKSESVHGAKIAPLSERPPIGFIFARQLFLFDVDLGCVYIFQNWDRPDLERRFADKGKDFAVKRINIPFEHFFRCPFPYSGRLSEFLPQTRCQTTYQMNLTSLRRSIFNGGVDGERPIVLLEPPSLNFFDNVKAQVAPNFDSNKVIFGAIVVIGIILFGVLPIVLLIRRHRRNSETKDKRHNKNTIDDIRHARGRGAKSKNNYKNLRSKNRKKFQKHHSSSQLFLVDSSSRITSLDIVSRRSASSTSNIKK